MELLIMQFSSAAS